MASSPSRRHLRLAHDYILQHLGERITLERLARASGLSRFHFSRLFRGSTGESPMRYVQRCRIEHAKRLIGQGELLMTEIALRVGFYDQSHFSRWFRKLVGMTPREFAHSTVESPIAIAQNVSCIEAMKKLPSRPPACRATARGSNAT